MIRAGDGGQSVRGQGQLVRQHDPGQLQDTGRPQADENIGAIHGDGALGEVDHAGAAVFEHQAEPEDGVDRSPSESQQKEEQVRQHLVHLTWRVRTGARRLGGPRPWDQPL